MHICSFLQIALYNIIAISLQNTSKIWHFIYIPALYFYIYFIYLYIFFMKPQVNTIFFATTKNKKKLTVKRKKKRKCIKWNISHKCIYTRTWSNPQSGLNNIFVHTTVVSLKTKAASIAHVFNRFVQFRRLRFDVVFTFSTCPLCVEQRRWMLLTRSVQK